MPLSRREAAEELGIGLRRLRDLEASGRLTPNGKRGERRTYSEAQIARYKREHPRQAVKPNGLPAPKRVRSSLTDGFTAAQIFAALARGEKKVAIVIALQVHPDLVEELALKFERMRQAEGEVPRAACVKCNTNAARFCGACSHAA